MTMITKKQFTDPNFGKCAHLSNGLIDLHVTLDVGPRVIYAACAGKENMFFQDTAKTTLGEKFDIYGGGQHILYGGHRLWFSPEIVPRCYHPDNLPVKMSELENGARFTAAVEQHNQIKKSITITLEEDAPRCTVVHTIRNVGLWDITLAPWAITMLAPGGIEVMPMPSLQTDLLPNRFFTFWDYSDLRDTRLYLGKDFLTLRQAADAQTPFKLGYNNDAGWAGYFNRGQVFLKFFEPVVGGCYPDNGCCFETYTNAKMLEMETLGEFIELEPDDFVTLAEEWEIYQADAPQNFSDEAELAAIIKKYSTGY